MAVINWHHLSPQIKFSQLLMVAGVVLHLAFEEFKKESHAESHRVNFVKYLPLCWHHDTMMFSLCSRNLFEINSKQIQMRHNSHILYLQHGTTDYCCPSFWSSQEEEESCASAAQQRDCFQQWRSAHQFSWHRQCSTAWTIQCYCWIFRTIIKSYMTK